MRVAVSVDSDQGLQSVCSPHFGRCPFFALVDLDGYQVKSVRTVANPFFDNHQPGQVPAFIHGLGADVMLSGGMGARAIGMFAEYGIQPVTGAAGTVKQALDQLLNGRLQGAESCRESIAHGQGEAPATQGYEQDAVGRLREEAHLLGEQLAAADDALKRLSKE